MKHGSKCFLREHVNIPFPKQKKKKNIWTDGILKPWDIRLASLLSEDLNTDQAKYKMCILTSVWSRVFCQNHRTTAQSDII